jgi:hypothetical protein
MTSQWKYHARYVGGGTMYNAYWWTPVIDVTKDPDITERSCVAEDYYRLIEASRLENKNFVQFKGNKTYRRRLKDPPTGMFFVSHRAYMGICPRTAMPGDLDYIAAGGAQMLIPRPVPADTGPNTFTNVVQCYVHGITDGDAVRGEA